MPVPVSGADESVAASLTQSQPKRLSKRLKRLPKHLKRLPKRLKRLPKRLPKRLKRLHKCLAVPFTRICRRLFHEGLAK